MDPPNFCSNCPGSYRSPTISQIFLFFLLTFLTLPSFDLSSGMSSFSMGESLWVPEIHTFYLKVVHPSDYVFSTSRPSSVTSFSTISKPDGLKNDIYRLYARSVDTDRATRDYNVRDIPSGLWQSCSWSTIIRTLVLSGEVRNVNSEPGRAITKDQYS